MKQRNLLFSLILLVACLPVTAVGMASSEAIVIQETVRQGTSFFHFSDWSDYLVVLDLMLIIAGVLWFGSTKTMRVLSAYSGHEEIIP